MLSVVTTRTATPEVCELGRMDLVVGDGWAEEGSPVAIRFSTLADDPDPGGAPACTPVHVAQAIWAPRRADVLVVHDLATAEVVFARPFARGLPFIDTGRVARALWPGAPAYDIDELIDWRGHREQAEATPGWEAMLPAAKRAFLTAVLFADLAEDDGLPDTPPSVIGRDWRWLGRIFGDQLGRPVLQRMVDLTAAEAEPLRYPPGPWDDDEEWHVVPAADLEWYARHGPSDWTRETARAELDRRFWTTGTGDTVPRVSRVLLRGSAGPLPRDPDLGGAP